MTTVQQASVEDVQERADIDRSTRYPVLFFFTSAAAWLFVAAVLGFFSALKLRFPGLGDDLPDLGAIVSAGLGMTVADASSTVREAADWKSVANGGCGAVREACEFILSSRGDWLSAESEFA